MARRKAVYPLEQWTAEVGEQLPQVHRPQAAVLAAWGLGMVVAHSCALTAVGGCWWRCGTASATPNASACGSSVIRKSASGERTTRPWRSSRVSPPCWAGCWTAGRKGAWRPVWERLLADRGLDATWLFQAIVAQGWHSLLHINNGGTSIPCASSCRRPGSSDRARAAPSRAAGRACPAPSWPAGSPAIATPGCGSPTWHPRRATLPGTGCASRVSTASA